MADSNIRTVFDIVVRLYDQGFTKVNMVVGDDRKAEFDKLLNKYNGEKGRHGFYQFEGGITVISAGARDPDSDDVTGMSASKLRAAAVANDFATFSKGMPSSYKDGKELFNAIRKGMGLKESHKHRKHIQLETVSEQREEYINGNLFSEGDTVVVKESNDVGTITMKGPNFVLVELADGSKKRHWLDSVEKLEEDYYADMSKSTVKEYYEYGSDEYTKHVKGMTPGELDEVMAITHFPKADRWIDRTLKKPIYKKAVRFYLDMRKKTSGDTDNAHKIMKKAAKVTGLDYKNLSQVFHDMIKKDLLPKHLAFEEDSSKSFKDYLKDNNND